MFSESAELYDLIYADKDYAAEAAALAGLLRRLHPDCTRVLDAACGTGEHARLLAETHGFEVDGFDLEPGFVELARAKHPGGRFFVADLADFSLPHRYDAVVCLFSSIGYLQTLDRVTGALRCFAAHLDDGGVVAVEPWFTPDVLEDGRTMSLTVDGKGLRIERTARTEVRGRLSLVHFDYAVESADGVRNLSETHRLGLFTVDEMLQAFATAGLEASYDDEGLSGRGLYTASVARRDMA